MLAHLRRSVILAVVCTVFFGFVYAFVGTGVAQLLFKHQADGSITANGSTLIGQNWSTPSARSSTGQLRLPGPARRHSGPTPANTNPPGIRRRQPPRGQRRAAASRRRPTSGRGRRSCSRTPRSSWPTGTSPRREPHPGPRHHLGQRRTTPTSRRRTPWCRSPWCPRPPASPLGAASSDRQGDQRRSNSASWAAATSTSCS